MSTRTDASNMALGHLGIGKMIADLDTERSAEAMACRRFFDVVLVEVLKAFPWKFASKRLALALVAEEPNDQWAYSYGYPADCVQFHGLLYGASNDLVEPRLPFEISENPVGGLLVFTNQDEAVGLYTRMVSEVGRWPLDFLMTFSYRLASIIGPSIGGTDGVKMADRAFNFYTAELGKAKTAAANEYQPMKRTDSESILARY